MPAGKFKKFYLKLLLNKQQRLLLNSIRDKLNSALKSAIIRGLDMKKRGVPVNAFLCGSHIKNNLELYGLEEFNEFEINSLVDRTSHEFERISNMRSFNHVRKLSFLFEIPANEITFSIKDNKIRLPVFGLVDFKKNQRTIANSEETNWYNLINKDLVDGQNLCGRYFIDHYHNEICLFIDITPKETKKNEQKLVRVDNNL